MKRWHQEIPLMLKRWRQEIENHRNSALGYIVEGCHCLRGKGFMRKRRPYESHSDKTCRLCRHERARRKAENRSKRRAERKVIEEELKQAGGKHGS